MKSNWLFYIVILLGFYIPIVQSTQPIMLSGTLYSTYYNVEKHKGFHVGGSGDAVWPVGYWNDPWTVKAKLNLLSDNTEILSLGTQFTFELFERDLFHVYSYADVGNSFDVFVPQLSVGAGYWYDNRYLGGNIYVPLANTAYDEQPLSCRHVIKFNKQNHGDVYYFLKKPSARFGEDVWIGSKLAHIDNLFIYGRVFFEAPLWGGGVYVNYDYPIGYALWPNNAKVYLGFVASYTYDSSTMAYAKLGMRISLNRREGDVRYTTAPRIYTPYVQTTHQPRISPFVKCG